MFNPRLFEFQRQTGAAGFARSSAVQNDVAIAGNLSGTLQQFVWIKPDSGWDQLRVRKEIQWVPEVHNKWLLSGVQQLQKVLWCDPSHPHISTELLAHIHPMNEQPGGGHDDRHESYRTRMRSYYIQLLNAVSE